MRFLFLIALMALSAFASKGQATTDIKLRQGPGTGYEAIGSVRSGETFEVLSQEGGFYRVNLSGMEGFVAAKYVQVFRPKSTYETIRDWTIYIGLGLYLIFALVVGEMMIRPSFISWRNKQTYIHSSNGNYMEDYARQGMRDFAFELQIAVLAIFVGAFIGWAWLIAKLVLRKVSQSKGAVLETD